MTNKAAVTGPGTRAAQRGEPEERSTQTTLVPKAPRCPGDEWPSGARRRSPEAGYEGGRDRVAQGAGRPGRHLQGAPGPTQGQSHSVLPASPPAAGAGAVGWPQTRGAAVPAPPPRPPGQARGPLGSLSQATQCTSFYASRVPSLPPKKTLGERGKPRTRPPAARVPPVPRVSQLFQVTWPLPRGHQL